MDIDENWLSVPCPRCRYEFEFTYLQARLEETIICPCCKTDIRLKDADASIQVAKREIDEAMTGIEKAFSKLNLKIRI